MKVLVTGYNGFIGKNLVQKLKEEKEIEVIGYEKDDSFSIIEDNIDKVDFIFHLAGVNRPSNNDEFYKGNSDLSKQIIELLKSKKLNTPVLLTSSIQATKDNDYGKSKSMAEESFKEYNNSIIYRLHNVFGKWCRPNYNSVVATFCYNVSHNEELTINDPSYEVELIYIDDIVKEFIQVLKGNKPSNKIDEYCFIKPSYKITIGDLASEIKSFKENLNSISVPTTGNDFTKKLFSTYISYVELDELVYSPKINTDDRGSFIELVKTKDSGQVSISTSKPGIIRGNHYHNTKIEKFIVIRGQAKIKFKHILTEEIKEFVVDGNDMKIISIPVGYTHNIENIGKEEMILLIWCNEIFDVNNPDTYFMEISKN